MEKTWRWFGSDDVITLGDLRQIGVEGIVSSLPGVAGGEVWSYDAIASYRDDINAAGLRWSVVESLPVSEAIKYGGADRDRLIENYKASLRNLGRAGIHTVCYNFMPVIDWIRTDLMRPLPDGTFTLAFDKVRFAYFDLYILERKNAESDYTPAELDAVAALAATITKKERELLVENIIVVTQRFVNANFTGRENDPVAKFKKLLSLYEGIDREALYANLKYFLERVIPVAAENRVNMCIHPDDPPFAVLGLPRIVTCGEDMERVLGAVDDPANGLTFCAGSLSAGMHNDVPEMAHRFAPRTHFVHLRSTSVKPNGDFMESGHLSGRGHLVELVKIFRAEERRRASSGMWNDTLPMRVDHGPLMLDDIGASGFNPGYSFIGRMKALAEMSGVMATVDHYENYE